MIITSYPAVIEQKRKEEIPPSLSPYLDSTWKLFEQRGYRLKIAKRRWTLKYKAYGHNELLASGGLRGKNSKNKARRTAYPIIIANIVKRRIKDDEGPVANINGKTA